MSFVALMLAPYLALAQSPDANPPRLVRNPSLSADRIAFLFADEIWTIPRSGGAATHSASADAAG